MGNVLDVKLLQGEKKVVDDGADLV